VVRGRLRLLGAHVLHVVRVAHAVHVTVSRI
jgi:hypothetical protein